MGKRSGILTRQEIKYIEQTKDGLTIPEIAEHLNRSEHIVRRTIEEITNRIAKTSGDRYSLRKKILLDLKQKSFFTNLKSIFNAGEISYFTDKWIDLIEQLDDDVRSSEESELRELITLEILGNRLLVENKALMEQNRPIQIEINKEYRLSLDTRDQDKINKLSAIIAGNQGIIKDNLKNYRDLSDRAEKTRKSLNASREQRTKALASSRVNFTQWLKQLQEFNNKKIVGKEMELVKMAKDKAIKDLEDPIKYADKTIDIPILNSKSAEIIED